MKNFLKTLAISSLFLSGSAFAACPAIPSAPLGAGADIIAVEGPLSAIDTVDRTLTVMGSCLTVPVGMLIDTSGDGIGDITLDDLATLGLRSPIGGTVIGDALASVDGAGNLSMSLTTIYFEYGEQVFVGPLVSVAADGLSFQAGGTTVQMNQDLLMPSDVLDLGGNLITVSDMLGFEGTGVAVTGWYDTNTNILNALLVETEVIVAVANIDSVVIDRAQWRQSKRSIDIRGVVTFQSGTGALAPTVTVDPGCDNVGLITTAISPTATGGTFTYRSNNNTYNTNPGTVCVVSPLGGTANRTVDTI